eukprot:ANDGO_06321.mRNA.1 hypothetical protein
MTETKTKAPESNVEFFQCRLEAVPLDILEFISLFRDSPFRNWFLQQSNMPQSLKDCVTATEREGLYHPETEVSAMTENSFLYCPFAKWADQGAGVYASRRIVVMWDGRLVLDVLRFEKDDMSFLRTPLKDAKIFLNHSNISVFAQSSEPMDHHILLLFRPGNSNQDDVKWHARLVLIHPSVILSNLHAGLLKVLGPFLSSQIVVGAVGVSPVVIDESQWGLLRPERVTSAHLPHSWTLQSETKNTSAGTIWADGQRTCWYGCSRMCLCGAAKPILATCCDPSDTNPGVCIRTGFGPQFQHRIVTENCPCFCCVWGNEVDPRTHQLYSRCGFSPVGCLFLLCGPCGLLPQMCIPPFSIGCRETLLGTYTSLHDNYADVAGAVVEYGPKSISLRATISPPAPVPLNMGARDLSITSIYPRCCSDKTQPPIDRLTLVRDAFSALGAPLVHSSSPQNMM